ncbi:MAG: ferritin [Deltaproteobacteria bacterium]|nr:ferritin [Deltaproteobacteria bacterium]
MEIQVSVQYMWQHVMVKGIYSETVGGVFRKIAIEEMKHAETIAERLDYLGGAPTTKPTPIETGKKAKEMIAINKKDEEAIALYKEIIALSEKEGDPVTSKLFTDILAEEEGHHNLFSTLLEE